MNIVPILYSKRCQLLPCDENDALWLFKLFNDEAVLDNMEGVKLFANSIDDTRHFIQNMNHQTQIGNAFLWAIRLDENPIGFVGIYDFMYNPNLFFAIVNERRGQGYATECVKLVTDYIHDNYGTSLTATTYENNNLSISVLHKSGYFYNPESQIYTSMKEAKKWIT